MGHDGARRAVQGAEVVAGGLAASRRNSHRNWRGHNDVMQTRSIRGSGEPAWVNASSNACFRLGPDPRRALGPAAAAPHQQAGHMTAPDQCCINVKKLLSIRRRPHMTDTVEKGFWGRSLSNIDSRSNATAQSRFKNPFVRIRLFQILIPQLHFGDFFNSIGQTRSFGEVGSMSGLPESGHGLAIL